MVDTVCGYSFKKLYPSCIHPKSPHFQRFGAPLDTWIQWIQPKSREKVKSVLTQKNRR